MSTPSSVSFCTTHSGRSPFTGANTIVIAGAARATVMISPVGSTASPNRAESPPARAIAHCDLVTVTGAEHVQVVAVGLGKLDVLEIGDEDVRPVPPVGRHLNAERIFEKRPASAGATSSPRSSASWRIRSSSARERRVGVSTRTRTSTSPRSDPGDGAPRGRAA